MLPLTKEKWMIVSAHVAGWILFMMLPFADEPELITRLFKPPFFFLIFNCFFIVYFYFNFNILVPRLLYEKRVWLFVSVTVLILLVICYFIPLCMREFMPHHPPPGAENVPFSLPEHLPFQPKKGIFLKDKMMQLGFFRHLAYFLLAFIVSTGIKVIAEWYRQKQRLQELEHSKISAELSFLKSQIHPHFLFNSLNSIYYLSISKDDKAPESIMRLSNFLRFVTTESDKDFIPLETEIHTLGEYLELQKLRASDKLYVSFEVEGNPEFRKIIPLVFLPFVENAFKYGVSARSESSIEIKIHIDKGILDFNISNTIFPVQKGISQSGVGLENIRKRLDLAYPGRHTLEIKEENKMFNVSLNIKL